jgi:hypothetical protein
VASSELSGPQASTGRGWHGLNLPRTAPGVDLRTVCWCWLALAATTALAAAAAVAWPGLAPATRPHAELHPWAGAVASILLNNLRVLAAPFILVAARFGRTRGSRLVGDAIVTAILAGNAVDVGLALGRWRGTLIPYVPQLPVEYLAAAVAAAAWLSARRGHTGTAPSSGAATIALTGAAAVIEVLLTPHAR